ncbi:ZYRO0A07304p [Zygosaccharomyces rouxii]|uniref:Non-structural maintenance of chromosomes element 4 n=1 Tax=Zygosaccharomyces rouxii (strain ATCC 2623 / CBS 732 / NBRC 1130 / NCYC 568 / NRRL Y-229) TaxID=559307 RepID=C5DPZ2_ZYGRC|nr:uncharacterized protein ZYRO0A07304g [Zygosaccharomyces rouxii]KAH9198726.1 Nse4 C-terminal-domain-containing protein [Zygosaccharomyces rouxii]CAR25753.1 ZYRO0A07304p [Zygosaccharomyces rouxii]
MAVRSDKRRRDSQDDSSRQVDKRLRLEGGSQGTQGTAVNEVEFEVLQGYRKFSEAVAEDRARMARTGDIDIAVKNLQAVDSLFNQLTGSRNNGLFAHDSRAMLSISELAQISVRNLKFDNFRSLVNLEDVLNSLKKYMLRDYFEWNGISEGNAASSMMNQSQNGARDGEEVGGDDNDDEEEEQSDNIRQTEMRKCHLKQYSGYEDFYQLNWFKLGGLFNNLSRKVSTVDHLLGPFSMQRKTRAPVVRKEQDTVGALTTAEKVTQSSLNSTQQITTPEQVKRMFKILERKNGKRQINLFKFVINPQSFSKSVENLFYVSFLIKEGRVVLEEDQDGFPSIRIRGGPPTDPKAREIEIRKRREASENHIIFQMDMPTWKKLIEKFDIRSAFVE